ncbi:BppU family phage baseplate upper protein [Caproiciproducens sp. R2]|uniref:BppU family phage baseplate upper protein n=1 Tax=Caproiciproducens sp. R2 TaxID=3435187 RepID=UPI004033B32C
MTNTDIKLNAWNLNYESQIAVQGEVNSRTLTVTLIDKVGVETYVSNAESVDRPIDLTGTAARLYVIKPDGTKTFSDGTIEDAENGIVSFLLPYQATTAAGSADCQILLTKSDNSELKIVGMTLDVLPSNLEGAIESTDEFSALVVALNSIQASIEQVNQAVLESQEAVENANTAISGANTARDSANTAAGLANEAAEAAETATEACVTATENANTATGNTNAAITSANSATTAANTAADRANEAAQNAEDAISGQLDPAIDARIAAKMNIAGGVAGYDNAVAHYSDTVAHVTQLSCTKTGTVYALTGTIAASGVPCCVPASSSV